MNHTYVYNTFLIPIGCGLGLLHGYANEYIIPPNYNKTSSNWNAEYAGLLNLFFLQYLWWSDDKSHNHETWT